MKIVHKSKDGKKKYAAFLVVLLLASAIFIASEYSGGRSPSADTGTDIMPAVVKTVTVKADGTVMQTIEQNTSVEAVNRVKLLPRVSGRLNKLFVKAGDRVKKGDIVAVLEHEQQNADIAAADASAASAHADSERAKAEMMNAGTNLDRYKRLLEAGFSTQQQYDATETAYRGAKAAYNAALAKERQAAADLKRVRSAKNDYIITSPIDGVVLSDYSLTTGAMISPNSPVTDIADLRRLKATLKIPESKIFSVKEGMSVYIVFDALPGEKFEGRVSRIDRYVNPDTRTSNVEIELDNEAAGGRLRPGMFGQTFIVEREVRGALVLPESAVVGREGKEFVFVVKDGTAVRREITIGIETADEVQVTSGLSEGEEVIIFGGKNLAGGEKVEVMK